MTEDEMRTVIRAILEALEEVWHPKRGLVVFTGALLGFDAAIKSLRQVKDKLPLTYVLTPSAEHVLDTDKIASLGIEKAGPHLVVNHDLLIIPTLTANTAAKAAYSMADSLATNLIMEFVMAGKPVVAASTAADPDSPDKRATFPHMPPGQVAVMRDNLARLSALGVCLCEADMLGTAIERTVFGTSTANATKPKGSQQACPERIVSAGHIQFLTSGSTLVVRRDAIVTQLAADLARTRSITIERA